MSKAISFSLFGFDKQKANDPNDPFPAFLRGLMVNVRFNRLLYPGWANIVHTDKESYTSQYQPLFDWLIDRGFIEVVICPSNEVLCRAMLWRVMPVFTQNKSGNWLYTHVLCRDLDSIATYREVQAVEIWIREDKTIHCITDSISHNVAMMGGMIGLRPGPLTERVNVRTFDELMSLSQGIDYTHKGADQTFLNKYVYPKCADSATEHFVLGMVHNLPEENGRHYSIEDINLSIPKAYKASNDCAGHVGAAGFYDPITPRFLNNIDPHAKEYAEIEKRFPGLFSWLYGK